MNINFKALAGRSSPNCNKLICWSTLFVCLFVCFVLFCFVFYLWCIFFFHLSFFIKFKIFKDVISLIYLMNSDVNFWFLELHDWWIAGASFPSRLSSSFVLVKPSGLPLWKWLHFWSFVLSLSLSKRWMGMFSAVHSVNFAFLLNVFMN